LYYQYLKIFFNVISFSSRSSLSIQTRKRNAFFVLFKLEIFYLLCLLTFVSSLFCCVLLFLLLSRSNVEYWWWLRTYLYKLDTPTQSIIAFYCVCLNHVTCTHTSRQNSSKVLVVAAVMIVNEVFNALKLPCSLFVLFAFFFCLFFRVTSFFGFCRQNEKEKKREERIFIIMSKKGGWIQKRKSFDHLCRTKWIYKLIKKRKKHC